jgi:hypothetical protein
MLALVLTVHQLAAMEMAHAAGAVHGNSRLVQAIVLHESSGCQDKLGRDGKSWGCGQVRPIAACDADHQYCRRAGEDVEQWHGRVRAVLLQDDEENIRLTAAYLNLCQTRYGYAGQVDALVCYSAGPTVAGALGKAGRAAQLYPQLVLAARKRLDGSVLVKR